jgi:hypothetical protein
MTTKKNAAQSDKKTTHPEITKRDETFVTAWWAKYGMYAVRISDLNQLHVAGEGFNVSKWLREREGQEICGHVVSSSIFDGVRISILTSSDGYRPKLVAAHREREEKVKVARKARRQARSKTSA